jgi:phosphoribosylformylglycinamidine synthase
MSFAGCYGIQLDLAPLVKSSGIDDPAVLLFSESNTRFLVEVPPDAVGRFEAALAGLPFVCLGEVTEHDRVRVQHAGTLLIDTPWHEFKAVWKKPLAWD